MSAHQTEQFLRRVVTYIDRLEDGATLLGLAHFGFIRTRLFRPSRHFLFYRLDVLYKVSAHVLSKKQTHVIPVSFAISSSSLVICERMPSLSDTM